MRKPSPADSFGSDDRLNYVILKSLDPPRARQYAALGSNVDRDALLDHFWQEFDSSCGLEPNQARQRHQQRAERAWRLFGATDLMNDDRVLTYIRHGPPHREAYNPRPVDSESLTLTVNPAEVWTYGEIGREFDFVKTGTAYKLVGESSFGPDVVMPSLEEVDLGGLPPAPGPNALPLGLEVALYRLQQTGDSIEVELHYGIPQRTLALIAPDEPLLPVRVKAEFQAQSGRTESRSLWFAPGVLPETADTRLAVGRQVFGLKADVYKVRVEATTRDARAFAAVELKLDLIEYVRRAQPSSDVVFCSLIDSSSQSPQFARGNWRRFIPLVRPEVKSGSTLYVYYELYNLGLDGAGWSRVEVTYDMVDEDTRLMAVIPTPARFSSTDGPKATIVERVHTMDLKPGPYLLVARCRDLASDRELTLTGRFTIRGH